jgi:peroxiredoxin Q/BCP
MTLEVGAKAPDFVLPSTSGELRLRDLTTGGQLVLAFYAEASTPLCSSEVSVLKEDYELVQELGAEVVAISADGLEAQQEFARRLGGLPFPLASDERLEAAAAYGVVDETGRRSQRAVFVIDREGEISHVEPWFQPGNPSQYESIFRALGFDSE